MGKLQIKKLVKNSILLFLASCYLNKNISVRNKKLYFEKIENFSNQPNLTFILKEKLEETILKYPKFEISQSEETDYLVDLKILKFERVPLFFSKENSEDIVGAKYEIEVDLRIKTKDRVVDKKIQEAFSTSIYKEYNEDAILTRICDIISKKIYFEILKVK